MKPWKVLPILLSVALLVGALVDVHFETGVFHAVFGRPAPDVFVALSGVYGTLMGIVFAVAAVWVSFVDKSKLDRIASSDDYKDIGPMIMMAGWSMAGGLAASISSLLSHGSPLHPWALLMLVSVTSYAATLFAIVMYRFSAMLGRLTESHSESARKRRSQKRKEFDRALPGEFDDVDSPKPDECSQPTSHQIAD